MLWSDEFRVKKIETGFLIEGAWDKHYRHRCEWAFSSWSDVLSWLKEHEPIFVGEDEEAPKAVAS